MSTRFLILGLDEPLRRQVQSDLKIAYPNAEVEMAPLPEDSSRNAEFAAYTALFIGYEHGHEDQDGKPIGPDVLLRDFKGCGAPLLILARGGNEMTAVDAVRAGAADYLPVRLISPPLLAARVKTALQTQGAPPVERRRSSQVRRTTVPGELPNTISGYHVQQTLARSDRSAVYLARSEELGFNVALKVLRRAADTKDAAGDEQRFAREYKIISQIRHRAIVDVYDFGSTDGLSYIATEYFPAGDLKTRLQNPMSMPEAIDYARQIAEALRVIHVAGVLHRDLKPANVMLRTDNSLVLIDFGLAKELTGDKALTGAGEIRGSPYYMSPEQAEGRPVDERSDLYALGVIFYELLTGTRPFQGRTVFDILAQHQHAPVPQLSGAVSRQQPLIDRLLAKSPAQRYQSATDFLTALRTTNP
ncbi:MAG TPA: protein kinase [Steroidobacteraceae bacterium]|nr:protein kinase [Steroidobacteraceae bacterium]